MGLLTATRERRVVHKVAVLGKAGAGKSALIATLQKRIVSEKYTETMGIQVVDVEGPVAYDGSGNELGTTTFRMWEVGSRYGTTFGYMNPEAVKDCAAAIVVFSFTDKASFQQVPSLLARCESNGIPCLLVGTKADDPAAGAVTAVELNMFCNERDVPSMIVDCFPQTSAKKPSSLSAERRPDPPQPKFVPQMLKKLAGMTDVVSSADTGTARMVR
mmetsp:Transcript_41328/g.107013  ORF Transcript_41328/g.107013 Transcript_41328/m.107013 type:complete len:216 (+) Transcript_41328:417-1064(+)